jgi:hypothetical protein
MRNISRTEQHPVVHACPVVERRHAGTPDVVIAASGTIPIVRLQLRLFRCSDPRRPAWA